MATNSYFNHSNNKCQQSMIESLTIEAIKMFGADLVYIPRNIVERDELFGEDIVTRFSDHHIIEMYIETVDGFEGGQDVLAKFGLQIVDQATFVVAKRRFEEVVPELKRPNEGDLIYFPLSKTMFEINHVEHENPFYQLGKLYTYKLTVEAFTYSHEEFDTGLDNIDQINDDRSADNELARGDNEVIQTEVNEILVKDDPSNEYPTVDDDNGFDPNNPFGVF